MPSKTVALKKDVPKPIFHKLKTEDVTVKVYDSKGKQIIVTTVIVSKNKITIAAKKDYAKARIEITGTIDLKESILKKIVDQTLRLAMSMKNVNLSYSENNGTMLPGYMPKTKILGLDGTQSNMQPGLGFVFGAQNDDFGTNVANNSQITDYEMLNTAYSMTSTNTLNARSSIEPLTGLRIDLTYNRSFSDNVNEYVIKDSLGVYNYTNAIRSGNYSTTFWAWRTSFEGSGGKTHLSKTFTTFLENRKRISERLGEKNHREVGSDGYADGYGEYSQDVLIASFMSAYSGTSPNLVSLTQFPYIIMPNWRATYNGLAKLAILKLYLKKINISHGYRSSYNIGSYLTNLDYETDPIKQLRDLNDNIISKHEITGVTISEQYSPLISIDMTWVNSLLSKIEIKKTRNVSMSLSNNQITEVKGNEYNVGLGYRFPQVPLDISSILPNAPTKQFKSDLNVRLDFSFRQDITMIRKFDAGNGSSLNSPTSGQNNIAIKFNADYKLGTNFTVILFYEKTIFDPVISTAYKRSDSKFGIKLTFMLAG